MAQIESGQVTMKPKIWFMLGSALVFAGLVASMLVAIYTTNLVIFLLSPHGPGGGQWRLNLLLNQFSWWLPVVALLGMGFGIALLKRYDFSYKRNYSVIAGGFIAVIFTTALLLNLLNLNQTWFAKGRMRGFYRQIEQLENQTDHPNRQIRRQQHL